jgi:CRP-like cAMP-binding protein
VRNRNWLPMDVVGTTESVDSSEGMPCCNVEKVSFRVARVRKNTPNCYRHACPLRTGNDRELLSCPHREDRLFCNLPPAATQILARITSADVYSKGATLFVEGQSPRGVFILCSDRVKLSTSSADGRTLILRIADQGEVLGLPATVTEKAYELTAEVIEPTQANFIPRQDFLYFLREHGEVALRVAQRLGETYHSAISEMRTIGLSHSAGEKLARFLLDLSTECRKTRGDTANAHSDA